MPQELRASGPGEGVRIAVIVNPPHHPPTSKVSIREEVGVSTGRIFLQIPGLASNDVLLNPLLPPPLIR